MNCQAVLEQMNLGCFGDPTALFFCLDRRVGPRQRADLGMLIQTFMLAAVSRGLGTCPQAVLATSPRTLAEHLALPSEQVVFAGMSLGHPDRDSALTQSVPSASRFRPSQYSEAFSWSTFSPLYAEAVSLANIQLSCCLQLMCRSRYSIKFIVISLFLMSTSTSPAISVRPKASSSSRKASDPASELTFEPCNSSFKRRSNSTRRWPFPLHPLRRPFPTAPT